MSVKHNRFIKKYITIVIAVILTAIANRCLYNNEQYEASVINIKEDELSVFFIDVGQADSSLVVTPGGKTVLIDTGLSSTMQAVDEILESLSISDIDYLVLTHAHSDHAGGAEHILKNYDVKNVMMTSAYSTQRYFEDFLDVLYEYKKDGVTEVINAEDYTFFDVGDVRFNILGPQKADTDDLNNSSIVLRLVYDEFSCMFMGDAEEKEEQEILRNYNRLESNVIKLGHHGSSTSSSARFMKEVNPELAIISCGKDNSYGHPHRETISLLEKEEIPYYRTDTDGTILVTSNGKFYEIDLY